MRWCVSLYSNIIQKELIEPKSGVRATKKLEDSGESFLGQLTHYD